MKRFEHASTSHNDAMPEYGPPNPVEPDGKGWEFVAAVATELGYPCFETRVVWYWKREVSS